MVKIVDSYSRWLASSSIPKLFINGDPAAFLIGPQREFCRTWSNQQEVTVKEHTFCKRILPLKLGKLRHALRIVRSSYLVKPDWGKLVAARFAQY